MSCSPKEMIHISHRGARLDNMENTITGFKNSYYSGADMLEMDTQITLDGIVVLYHPADLSVLTDCKGKISDKAYNELKSCRFTKSLSDEMIIPTLEEAIRAIPADKMIMLDLKTNDLSLIPAISKVINETNSKDRVVFYSTNSAHNAYLKTKYPEYKRFQSRNDTREILSNVRFNNVCRGKISDEYVAFELKKDKLYIVEKLTMGNYETELKDVKMIDKKSVKCIRSINKNAKIFLFGVGSKKDYKIAKNLGVDGVVLDTMSVIN